MKIIKAHTRTIFVDFDYGHYTGLPVVKYKLNLPKMIFDIDHNSCIVRAINDKNELCYTPLLNIFPDVGEICFGKDLPFFCNKKEDYIIEKFFNSKFNLSLEYSLDEYIKPIHGNFRKNVENIQKFLDKWQKKGKLKLKPIKELSDSDIKILDFLTLPNS